MVGGENVKALIFDTETTGLPKNRTIKLDKQPDIIEFYGQMVNLKTGKIGPKWGTLIKPRKPLSDTLGPGEKKTISQITGITNEMLKDAPSFKDVSKQIVKMIRNSPVVIAHNLSFDAEMIDIELERLKIALEWPRKICTVEATIAMKGFRLNLTKLHLELFGKEFEDAHRAKGDVDALTPCCIELFKRGIL
jgi:DNA polymerase-3 subunit epsilon